MLCATWFLRKIKPLTEHYIIKYRRNSVQGFRIYRKPELRIWKSKLQFPHAHFVGEIEEVYYEDEEQYMEDIYIMDISKGEYYSIAKVLGLTYGVFPDPSE